MNSPNGKENSDLKNKKNLIKKVKYQFSCFNRVVFGQHGTERLTCLTDDPHFMFEMSNKKRWEHKEYVYMHD